MNALVERLAANISAARQARRWSQQQLCDKLAERGVTTTPEDLDLIESGEREPGITETAAIAGAFNTSVDALMTNPDDFEQALVWTALRTAYSDARRRLMRDAAEYERASEAVCDYLDGDERVPRVEREELERQVAQSAAWVALDGYNERDPWRIRWGIPIDKEDPVAKL
ncbi:MAG: helix-turn-helix domain-containing protein [Acidipropionibacterium sp.]|jgi:transcriptional regulator with XRE-family HTH domain|nr:helix-turn-helix domain-containing protein [Acidipropionibacterium sp.]